MHVLAIGISILPLSTILIYDFGIVPQDVLFLFFVFFQVILSMESFVDIYMGCFANYCFFFLYYVKVKVSVYKDNTEEAYFLFHGTESNKTNWFSRDRLLDTSYTDLMNVDDSRLGYYFSIDGYVLLNSQMLFPFGYQLLIFTSYEGNNI